MDFLELSASPPLLTPPFLAPGTTAWNIFTFWFYSLLLQKPSSHLFTTSSATLYLCNSGNWGYLLNTKKATLSKINGDTSSVVLASWRCCHVHPCTITFHAAHKTKCCNWWIPTCTGHLGLDQCKVFLGWGRCLAPMRFHKSAGFILVTLWWVCMCKSKACMMTN